MTRLLGRILIVVVLTTGVAHGSAYDLIRAATTHNVHAVDPDLTIRRIDPYAPRNTGVIAEEWGIPPLLHYTKVPGVFDRVDFFYPLGFREESKFQSRLKFFPFFESRWAKLPPFDGFSRCLTLYQGRSDLGQDYWGFFPFYGYNYRRYGVDRNFFLLFPLYYESVEDNERTQRFLWPLITYADCPGRKAVKFWPLFGTDVIRDEYRSWFFLWPILQSTERFPGSDQWTSYKALPFPLYVEQQTNYDKTTYLLWPIFSYYHHCASNHSRVRMFPLITYGWGGGVDEFSFLSLYWYKTDRRNNTSAGSGDGYVVVGGEEVSTEQSFMMISRIKKLYRKGNLVYSKYRLWPLAEYVWDIEKGSHFKFPNLIPVNFDWWDMNLGRLLSFVSYRETSISKELSLLSGLTKHIELKPRASIPHPPKPGDDGWAELISGALNKR
jgi:hypothetical protein